MSRPVASINLDPANDQLQDFDFDLDIRDLITLQDVMDEFGLGPNAGWTLFFFFFSEDLKSD
jgi:hypothetical protein